MLAQRINGALRRVPPWLVYVLGVVPFLWLVVQIFTGGLGVDPTKAIEHSLGLYGLQFLIGGLAVTPLRRLTGVSLIRYRRAIGLVAFFYVSMHLLVWITLDLQFRWGEIGADIVKRPYIMLGFAGFLAMLPLALTSNNLSIRRLGAPRWQKLHRLVYLAALAGAVHFVWLVKAWPPQPILYLGAVLVLLGVRYAIRVRGKAPAQRAAV